MIVNRFGERIQALAAAQDLIDCDTEVDYAPAGFRWRVACPADKVVEKAAAAKARPAPSIRVRIDTRN